MNEKEFIIEFEKIFKSRFGLVLNDVNKEVVEQCCIDGWTPEETVEWIGRKYDLGKINVFYCQ